MNMSATPRQVLTDLGHECCHDPMLVSDLLNTSFKKYSTIGRLHHLRVQYRSLVNSGSCFSVQSFERHIKFSHHFEQVAEIFIFQCASENGVSKHSRSQWSKVAEFFILSTLR